ncbi:IS91 family transposase [Bradyrhizobium sp.]|uniref:IS91 family transposase n=1 Tax=Bradyrhizobium sp. TaxID=376 RepID=UPI0025BF0C3B|nr:IS91 family transposase [Bradyrhizobium sp.]MBV8918977.1 IS91 family transposase [Bradyrhizobium sp.]
MSRPALEVADIFRSHGPAWRKAHAGHVSLEQLKVMSAIEHCRTAALGGHVARCADCAYTTIAYNSCRNRHCPKCQGAAAKDWLADREAELLPLPYYHVVFTLPAAIADIAYQNKAVVCDLLFKASAETLLTIAADPKHLGAKIGITSVLHTWGSAMTYHPHVHMIVPGGGISLDGQRWVSCRPGFFLPVRVLSRLFRRLFLEKLVAAHHAGRLSFFRIDIHLADAQSFTAFLAPLRKAEWVVYAKRPFGGPQAVLAYLSRYTHRVAIANSRLIAFDERGVTFKWKDYRIEGRDRYKQMTLATDEFIRRFLIHVLPKGLHRIRHYGLFARGACADNIARARELLAVAEPEAKPITAAVDPSKPTCPCCGGRMIIIEVFARDATPRHQPTAPTNRVRIDTS